MTATRLNPEYASKSAFEFLLPDSGRTKIRSVSTSGHNGYHLTYNSGANFSILYIDTTGRVACLAKGSTGSPSLSIISGSSFAATNLNNSEIFLRTGDDIRSLFIITSYDASGISLSLY